MPSAKALLQAGVLAGLAVATPQQLDFNDIAAAPSVAVGPAVTGPADQTAALVTTFAVSAVTASAASPVAARGLARRQTTNTAYNAGFGSSSMLSAIAAGQLNWLSGGNTHNIQGNLNNYGSLVISQTSYLKSNPFAGGQTCNWAGHDSNNGNLQNFAGGLIQLNDVSAFGASTYNWYLHSIQNAGTLQFCGRGDLWFGSSFQLYSDLDATNTGLISFEQSRDNFGGSFVWRNSFVGNGASANLYNHGGFRLINTCFHNVQNVYGTGCWQLSVGATLYLEDGTATAQNPSGAASFSGQSIIFADASAVIHFDAAVYRKNSNFGAQIYGFGSGNAIEFVEAIKSYSYSSLTGVLSVKFTSGTSCNLKLGAGYDASKFDNQRNPSKYNPFGYNAIFYKGSCPSQSAPATCSLSAPTCGDLGKNPPTSSPCSTSLAGKTSTSSSVQSTTSSSSAVASTTPVAISSSTAASSSAPSTTSVASTSPISTSGPISTAGPTSTSFPSTSATDTAYTPYYPALSTTANGTATATYSSTTACPTTPENGTYCGFINPEDPCAPQPDGYGPVPTPDTASAFLAYPPFHSMASAAPTAIASTNNTQYTQVFRDLNASSSANSFIQLLTIKSYDATYCAAQCDQTNLCTAFNIYIERDPSLNPTNNDSTAPTIWGYDCPNPASMTTYKCTLWGSELDASTATNQGQYREQFQVVITGSNGYDKTNVTTPQQPSSPASLTSPVNTATGTATPTDAPATSATSSTAASSSSSVISSVSAPSGSVASTFGTSSSRTSSSSAAAPTSSKPSGPLDPHHPWKPGHNCHGKGIDAPHSHLCSHFFPGPFNPQVCSEYALSQNAANKAAAQQQGLSSYSACQFFNAQYLHKNGKPHGTYCRLFTAALDDSFATFSSAKNGAGDLFECRQSWTFELEVHDSGRC